MFAWCLYLLGYSNSLTSFRSEGALCGVITSPATIKVLRLSRKVPDILNCLNQIWSFLVDFRRSPGYQSWRKSVPLEQRWYMRTYKLALFATMRRRMKESDTTLFYTTWKTSKLHISANYLVILRYAARIIAIWPVYLPVYFFFKLMSALYVGLY